MNLLTITVETRAKSWKMAADKLEEGEVVQVESRERGDNMHAAKQCGVRRP